MHDHTFTRGGRALSVSIESDDDSGAPWENEDGHGDVSDWTTRDKLPGEMVLSTDHGSKRFYDFAGACQLARRDGWGWLPGDIKTAKAADGSWRAWVIPRRFGDAEKVAALQATAPEINAAIREVYARHRATMTARQYAAGAALVDFESLRDWCNDSWSYVGIVVTDDATGDSESLWGIESDAGEYLQEVRDELADQILDRIGALQAAEMTEARPDLAPQWEGV